MSNKQTAVEWLVEKLKSQGLLIGEPDNLVVVNQAKQMDKEQIIEAFEIGYNNGACVQEGNAIYHGGNYYNETFGKNENT